MDLYSAFLVLMTTQSSLQYSFTFTYSHTQSYSASISSTLLFYEGQFGVPHLAQGHLGMQMGKTGDRTADLQVRGRPLYSSATAARNHFILCTLWDSSPRNENSLIIYSPLCRWSVGEVFESKKQEFHF